MSGASSERSRPGIGERRRPLRLARIADGTTLRWTLPARKATCLLFLHGPGCDACVAYLAALQRRTLDLERLWDGRVLAVIPAPAAAVGGLAGLSAPGLSILTDPDGAVRRRYGVGEDQLAAFVADRWGQIFDVMPAKEADELPGSDELESWFRFLATQCPECGVSDEPDEINRRNR